MMTNEPDISGLGVRLPSPLAELHDECIETHGVRLYLKRDDLIHRHRRHPGTRDAADKTDPTYGRFDPTYVNHRLRLGDTEEWTLRNDSIDHPNHPFHLHTNHFLVTAVDGTPLDTPIWQDTTAINQGGSVVIRVPIRDFTGRVLVHCHQLQHEDRGMMQLIEYVV